MTRRLRRAVSVISCGRRGSCQLTPLHVTLSTRRTSGGSGCWLAACERRNRYPTQMGVASMQCVRHRCLQLLECASAVHAAARPNISTTCKAPSGRRGSERLQPFALPKFWQRRIGTEHEKLVVLEGSHQRAPYEKILHVLDGLVERHGWEAVLEDDAVVGAEASAITSRVPLGAVQVLPSDDETGRGAACT